MKLGGSGEGFQSRKRAVKPDADHLRMKYGYIQNCFSDILLARAVPILVLIGGCNLANDIIKDHHETCRREAKIVVNNEELWQQYLSKSRLAYEKRLAEFGPAAEPDFPEVVDGFDESYGENGSRVRPFTADRVVRNNIYIKKGEKVVATVTDFLTEYRSIDGPVRITCVEVYRDLFLKGDYQLR